MHQKRNNSLSTLKNHSNTVPQKENNNSPKTKLTDYCNPTDREFKIAVMKKFTSYKKTQKGSSVSSEIKLMNKRDNITKRLKLKKIP